MGPGSHLKQIIISWLGTGVGGCGGCEKLLADMDSWGPEGCRQRIREIAPTIQRNAAKNPDWKARILARIPGIRLPIVSIVFLAIARAEADLKDEEAAKTPSPPLS